LSGNDPGLGNEGRELIDRHLESADRESLRHDDASRQSFDLLTAALALQRTHHHEFAGRQRDPRPGLPRNT
jgi:hypothetical protein